ncbi:tyrosine-type recombinase/integrase [Sedimentitalea sp. XS_ASV28]|uniref:tyrosine-type recombinase/integrase n=1 Tax=Sedimentitalea sp. XS_ASV28 TaxID=3241296 RepID=UPI003517E566
MNQSDFFPSGNQRWYYRPKGETGIAMPDAPKDSPEFLAAYIEAAGEKPQAKPKTFKAGTLGAGVTAYLGSCAFQALAPSTRERWRTRCDDIRRRYGAAPLNKVSAKNIKRDLANYDGHAANNRLKVWRSLFRYWDEMGDVDVNVALMVAKRKTAKTEGFTPWTRNDFDLFRAHWAIGTPQRMAFELMYRTCAAIGDTCNLNISMVDADGWLTYTRQKSKSVATCPFHVIGPSWFEATDDLALCLEAAPRHFNYLCTKGGKTRSEKAATTWFSKAARAAGLEAGKTAHGIRKGRAAIFKENGASSDQRMALLGHESETETLSYSKSADLRRTIEGTKSSNLSEQVPTSKSNNLKQKGKSNAD